MHLACDIKSTLRALLPLVEEKAYCKFLDKALEDYRAAPAKGWTHQLNRARKPFTRNIWRSKLVILPPMTLFSPVHVGHANGVGGTLSNEW